MAKPAGPVAHRADYSVRAIAHARGAQLITAHHYARGCSNTSVYMFGLFNKEGHLVGASQWLPPTATAARTVNPDWKTVLCLSRLIVLSSEPTNAESLFLARCMRTIRKDGRWKTLLTYADTAHGHTGTIYRASNWQYLGQTVASARYISSDGRTVAKKSTHNRTKAEMLALGCVPAPASVKHKYVLHLS